MDKDKNVSPMIVADHGVLSFFSAQIPTVPIVHTDVGIIAKYH